MGDAEWDDFFLLFSKRAIDGRKIVGRVKRRFVNGEAQYRKMTEEESAEYILYDAW